MRPIHLVITLRKLKYLTSKTRLMEFQRTGLTEKYLVGIHQGARFHECLTVHDSVVHVDRKIGRELSRATNS